MEVKDKLNIKSEFGDTPGSRYRKDGDHSGEAFLKDYLEPRFLRALKEGYIIEIQLDGLWGSPSSFISGSFGILSTEYTPENVLKHIRFKSDNQVRLQKYLSVIKKPKSTV
jgi:hypothetical protein